MSAGVTDSLRKEGGTEQYTLPIENASGEVEAGMAVSRNVTSVVAR